MITEDFIRVTRQHPCPVCEKTDWCLIRNDDPDNPSEAICSRVPSKQPWGDAGHMHVLRDAGAWKSRPRPVIHVPEVPPNRWSLASAWVHRAREEGAVETLADRLGVSAHSLERLHVGWCPDDQFFSFPLSNKGGRIVGINRRFLNGEKRVIEGHRIGLYLPHDLPKDLSDRSLVVCEGGSDTAAALDLGLDAIGRFSCNTCTRDVVGLVRDRKPAMVIIVADPDGPGRDGAEALAGKLLTLARDVRVIEPPAGDLREWIAPGISRRDFGNLVAATEPLRITIQEVTA